MKCPKCDTKNPDDSKFCNECGTELISPSVTKTLQTPPTSPGKTIAGKYKILSELGRGGMGVVYKANDTRLKRTVALKFLPTELTKDKEAKKRFIQEAQASAALEHPNICIVHEVDEADDQTFIAMSYIEGQSLKDKLKKGPMDIDEAKDIAVQVAEGLKEAHEKGIVHRDIKPANIMLTKKGQAKITDFGLAKLSWGVDLTKTSTIMGTVAYMSPEQAKGEEVDHRTDIWSLGAMLYEMLAGKRPFMKSQEHALIYSILNDQPRALNEIRTDIPGHIEDAINKALEKDLSIRYQSIQEFINDLKQSAPISLPKTEKSIVVLPFDDMSPNRDNEYFSDGLTEEIISDLSQINDLLVISRSSAMTYKGTKKKIKEIGQELNVKYVLEGSVRKAGNNLRITAQLIDAVSDAHLWAKKYSGTLDDVFDIQEKVSRSIMEALQLKLAPHENKKISERPIVNVHAYDCYLKARQAIYFNTESSLAKALEILENGLEILGEDVNLYAGLALVYLWYYELGFKTEEETLPKAEEYAHKLNKLQTDFHHYYYILGRIERFRGNAITALKLFNKALTIEPNDPETLMYFSIQLLVFAGKPEIAEPYFNKLIEIDPLTPYNDALPAYFYMMKGDLDSAIQYFQKVWQMNPEIRGAKVMTSIVLSWNGQFDAAIELCDQTVVENPKDWQGNSSLFMKYALQGKSAEALLALSENVKEYLWNDPDTPWMVASWYSFLHESEEAIKWLEHTVNRGFINYPLLELDPFLENIRGEPRFKKLMERVKHEWENFEV